MCNFGRLDGAEVFYEAFDRAIIVFHFFTVLDKYGVDGVADLRTEATKSNICINKILMANKNSNATDYSDILNNTSHFTQILVCFCDSDVLRNMLLAVKELNMTRKFIFIAT